MKYNPISFNHFHSNYFHHFHSKTFKKKKISISPLKLIKTIKMPDSSRNYIEELIKSLKERLERNDLSEMNRRQLESRLQALEMERDLQMMREQSKYLKNLDC